MFTFEVMYFHSYFRYNSVESAICLLKEGSDASKVNKYGTSALHFAARRGNVKLCKLLVDHINPKIRDMAQVLVI